MQSTSKNKNLLLSNSNKKLFNLLTKSLIFFTLLTIISINKISTKKCGLHNINIKPKINTAMLLDSLSLKNQINNNNLRFLQSYPFDDIKIFVDYTYMNSQENKVDKEKINLAKTVIENSVKIYSNLLKVQKFKTKIKLTDSCGDIPVNLMNKNLTTAGIDDDIVIFPMFDLKAEETTEAYATPCHIDPLNNRPISGIMAFNPLNFHTEMKNSVEYYTMLVVHEVNHILAFNESLFEYFVNPKTYTALGLKNVVNDLEINGVRRKAIVTPKVVEMARLHFNCEKIKGVELENQGGSGTAGSHWDARVMLGDFMIGETYPENVLSEISLALFEDSGWYKVNYYTGGLFRYGKNKGCEFVINKCIKDGASKYPNTFCLKAKMQMCFANKMSKGACDLGIASKDLKKEYQYFPNNPKKGGYIFADFCPVAHWNDDQINNMYYSNSCNIGKNHFKNLGEKIGGSSSCFMSSLIPNNLQNSNILKGKNRAICYPVHCEKKSKTYTVKVLNISLQCPTEGGIVSHKDFNGEFYCTDYNSICTKTAECRDAIDCAMNKVEFERSSYDYIVNPKSENATLNTPMLIAGEGIDDFDFDDGTDTQRNDVAPLPSDFKNNSKENFKFRFLVLVIMMVGLLMF